MTRTHILLIATLLGFSALAACSDDAGVDGSTDATNTADATPNLPVPEHECGYDAECEGKIADLTPCEDAVCEAGACVRQTRSTWASCDHPDQIS